MQKLIVDVIAIFVDIIDIFKEILLNIYNIIEK